MNKKEYYKISIDSGLPNRCPILEYCQRRTYTIYFYSRLNENFKSLYEAYSKEKILPPDYAENEIKFVGEAPIWSAGDLNGYFENMCPEVNLFDTENALNFFKGSATTNGVWDDEFKDGTKATKEKHYSECAEFSKYHYQNYILKNPPKKSKPKSSICYLYLMINQKNGLHKIGISSNPIYREKTLRSEEPKIETVTTRKFKNRKIVRIAEKELHDKYDNKRVRGEWFDLNPVELKEIMEYYKRK